MMKLKAAPKMASRACWKWGHHEFALHGLSAAVTFLLKEFNSDYVLRPCSEEKERAAVDRDKGKHLKRRKIGRKKASRIGCGVSWTGGWVEMTWAQ
jgi:hypothetical protein